MAEAPTSGCCARCWALHRRCSANSMSRPCGKCSPRQTEYYVSDEANSVRASLPFPRSLTLGHDLFSASAHGLGSNVWKLAYISSSGQETLLSLEDLGLRSTMINMPTSLLDTQIRQSFAVDLKARDANYSLIAKATLARAYLCCYCSTKKTSGHVETFVDGVPTISNNSGSELAANFRNQLLHRLGELVEEYMLSIRLPNAEDVDLALLSNAYAATVILHYEVNYFQGSLRYGTLRSLVPDTVTSQFLEWLISLELELSDYIRDGCGKFPKWRSPIKGSMKDFSRHRQGETLELSIGLHESLYSYELPQWSPGQPTQGIAHTMSPDEESSSLAETETFNMAVPYSASLDDFLDPTATADQYYCMPNQVPHPLPPSGDELGPMSSSPLFQEMDLDSLFGNDVSMTSQDPDSLVSDDWMHFLDSY